MLIPSIFGPTLGMLPTMNGIFAVSSYSPFSDGTRDDSPAFIACVSACVDAGGGVVEVDVPLWLKGSSDVPGGMWDGSASGASNIVIRGRADAAPITVDCPTRIPFPFANWNFVAFIDLVIIGGGPGATQAFDCQYLFWGSSWQLLFERCQVLNVNAELPVLNMIGSTTYINHSKFSGCCSRNGPGMIAVNDSGNLSMFNTHIIDYGFSRGVQYGARTNPNYPWIYYRGNGKEGGVVENPGMGVAVHITDCFFDEGCKQALDVAKLDPAKPRIRNVVIDSTGGNYSVVGAEAFRISGVDSFVYRAGDWGWQDINNAFYLRDIGLASIERFDSVLPANVDVDGTVSAIELIQCKGLTISGSPGHSLVRFNGVEA